MHSPILVIDVMKPGYITSLSKKFGLDPREVADIVDGLLVKVQDEMAVMSTLNLAPFQGEWLLANERCGTLPAAVQTRLDHLRREGVRNEDIRCWYNLCELDRRILLAIDEFIRQGAEEALRRSGLPPEQAAQLVRKRFPRYVLEPEPDDGTADRPLPVELMLRVTDFLEDWMAADPEGLNRALAHSSSCNALVRRDLLGLGRAARPCVLVVDDDSYIRKMLVQLLQHLGYDAAEAGGGHEALVRARAIHPSAVLMDLMMPEGDGYAAARQLKSEPALADIPIAAFSALDSPETQRAAREAGMSLFLPKPASPELLEQTLRQLIPVP